ncbi:hypothetical protein Q7P35_007832 [Cladosporium inversicolor]
MPPKKRATRAAQLQPQPAVSDYDETDTATFTDNAAALIAPPPSRTNTELNLLVLRRYCPDVERIVQIAPFAVVYSFSPETQGWEKIGTEGTLFVCQLAGANYSRYSVIILNRKSLDNFIVELVSAESVEITDSYVILQDTGADGVEQIYGLWIFSEENTKPTTQEVVAMAIEECALRAEEGRKIAEESYESEATTLYGHDGVQQTDLSYQAQLPAKPVQLSQAMPPAGQQIDLMHLFGKPQAQQQQQQQQQQHVSQPAPQMNQDHFYQQEQQQQPIQQPKFASNPDTDFFRSSPSPAIQAQAQQPPTQAPSQQNMLLDMLNSARRG